MAYAQGILIKGKQDRIAIFLDKSLSFNEIKEELKKKASESKKFFDGMNTAVSFEGKNLSIDEERSLLEIMEKNANMKIAYIYQDFAEESKKDGFEEKDNSVKNIVKEKIVKTEKTIDKLATLAEDESLLKIHRGSIRGGMLLEFDGSILVIGDINPGGFVHAKDNIIVLGSLKGQAHAGVKGNKDAFVAALCMIPTQLRIAHIITRIPEEIRQKAPIEAEYAFIRDDNITITPLA